MFLLFCGFVSPCEHLPKVRVGIDPSGYVYEAVADNRVENATATIYYKQTGEDEYGDLHDEVVKWRAEEFRQENPLLTDAEGKYAWDVPQGLWQVKIEKAGYETAYSDWLPVPPPQLDINIPLVRNTLPEVQTGFHDSVPACVIPRAHLILSPVTPNTNDSE